MGKKKQKGQSHNQAIGKRGENAAARYLDHFGYEILERNWKCPAGEADIIAFDEYTLVFIEVKTRTSFAKGFPTDAVTEEKMRRYEKIACWYLSNCNLSEIPVRFDVISLVVLSKDRAFIRHYKNAFEVTR